MRNVITIILLSALVLVSCVKDLNWVEPELEVSIPERQITLTAIGEDGTSTKTARDETDGSIWWTPGDAISVFSPVGDAISVFSPVNNKLVCNVTEPSRVAGFSGTIQDTYYESEVVNISSTSIGEIVDASGYGVVSWISGDGKIALLMSVRELQGKDWNTSNNWCNNYADGGWRMPTIDELTLIHGNFSAINEGLQSSGFTQLTTANKCYWSSTVNPTNSNYYYRERLHDGTIFKNTGNNERVNSTANYTRAVKTVLLNSPAAQSFLGLYPYDETIVSDGVSVTTAVLSTQTAMPDTFAPGIFPALGRSDGSYIKFYNICGGIRFSVTRDGIRKIVLRGNNGETIAGKVKVGFSANGVPEVKEIVDGVDEIVLTTPDNGALEVGRNYYIVLLPTVFTSGLTMKFVTEEETGTYNRPAQTTIKRSVFSGLKNIDSKVVYNNLIPETIDLGLSVNWASWNLGATSPEMSGDYYAWGEIAPKSYYDWSNYFWGDGSSFKKYNSKDNITMLEFGDDAAAVFLDNGWRTPSWYEANELLQGCTWTRETINGIVGYKGISKYNSNSIFFPLSGLYRGSSISELNETGIYWTSEVYPTNTHAYSFYFMYNNKHAYGRDERRYGYSIRPITEVNVDYISLNKSESTIYIGGKETGLEVIFNPSRARNKSLIWESSDPSVAVVDQDGIVYGQKNGSAVITATSVNGGHQASCTISVVPSPEPVAVDLGLSVKWATWNVGAEAPEVFGYGFAWGETGSKSNYSWSNYKWCLGSETSITKYCLGNNISSWKGTGSPDNKTILDSEDDVVHVCWGGNWRMPTIGEWQELFNNCYWQWTNDYNGTGVGGYIVSSNKDGYLGQCFFLPAERSEVVDRVHWVSWYWSSTLTTDYSKGPNVALGIQIGDDTYRLLAIGRESGLFIRAVKD